MITYKIKRRKAYLVDGKKIIKYFYGNTEREVYNKMTDFENEIAKGEQHLFTDVSRKWSDSHYKRISGNTAICYSPALKRANSTFSSVPIADITPKDIQNLIDTLARQHYSAQTVRVQKNVLNLIFKYAMLEGYCDNNPVTAVSLPRNLPHSVRQLPSQKEIDTVIESVDKPFGLFAYFLLFTGCRRGEALALQWKDIDFKNKVIHINKSVNYSGDNQNNPIVENHTKTQSGTRDIILLDILAERLMPGKPNEYVFGLPTKSSLRKKWQRYLKETGLDLTPHQLRHAYATILYDAQIDEKSAQALMGHSNINITRQTYTHISQSRSQQTVKQLNDFVNKNTP